MSVPIAMLRPRLRQAENEFRAAAAPRDERTMHNRHAVCSIERDVFLGGAGGVRRDQPVAKQVHFRKQDRGCRAVQHAYDIDLHRTLRHVQPELAAKIPRGCVGALQQCRCRGFDPIRHEHASNEIAMATALPLNKGDRILEALKAAFLIEHRNQLARFFENYSTGTVGGAQIDTQAEVAGSVRRGVEFSDGLAHSR